ncbi:hypothetical protein B0J13DRAFT_520722 [Dactylonectria estremocensis]|uniref:Uncharacterized protein n=1 Tax=Dactylonectria estremocensis TaxID=1079267 RepID=A0A9P9FDU4_9HYPO|nr:hypothetical protein B0J13DRAFT_520722 [Dactylonectria estremocensis]
MPSHLNLSIFVSLSLALRLVHIPSKCGIQLASLSSPSSTRAPLLNPPTHLGALAHRAIHHEPSQDRALGNYDHIDLRQGCSCSSGSTREAPTVTLCCSRPAAAVSTWKSGAPFAASTQPIQSHPYQASCSPSCASPVNMWCHEPTHAPSVTTSFSLPCLQPTYFLPPSPSPADLGPSGWGGVGPCVSRPAIQPSSYQHATTTCQNFNGKMGYNIGVITSFSLNATHTHTHPGARTRRYVAAICACASSDLDPDGCVTKQPNSVPSQPAKSNMTREHGWLKMSCIRRRCIIKRPQAFTCSRR